MIERVQHISNQGAVSIRLLQDCTVHFILNNCARMGSTMKDGAVYPAGTSKLVRFEASSGYEINQILLHLYNNERVESLIYPPGTTTVILRHIFISDVVIEPIATKPSSLKETAVSSDIYIHNSNYSVVYEETI